MTTEAFLNNVPTYSPAERDRRWNLARKFMEAENLDALLVFGEHEDAGPGPAAFDMWFTNHRPGTTVIFPRTGEPISLFPMPLYIMDHLESTRRGDSVWIPPRNVRSTRDSSTVVATLKELNLAQGRVGVVGLEASPPWHPEGIIPHQFWDRMLKGLPDIEFKPVDHAMTRIVMPQSREEIAVVRHTAAIGDAMVRAMVDKAAVGISESEVYAAGMAAGYARGAIPSAMVS